MAKPRKLSPEAVAKEWIVLKARKNAIEGRLEKLKVVLEPLLESRPEKRAELAGWEFRLNRKTRESFKLGDAKEKIALSVLKPFITVSEYNEIRTTYLAVDKAA